jgi:hypothetical protein
METRPDEARHYYCAHVTKSRRLNAAEHETAEEDFFKYWGC